MSLQLGANAPDFLHAPAPEPSLFDPARQSLIDHLVRNLGRVQDHMLRMNAGVASAVDDLAVALRVLVDSGRPTARGRQGGAGGHLLQRVVSAFSVEEPELLTYVPPVSDAIFSVGSIPVTIFVEGIAKWPICRGTVDQWLDAPVAVMSGIEPITWRSLITTYANKLGGAHADDNIPAWLDRMDYNGVGGFALTGYLLFQAGDALWHLGHEVLRAVHRGVGVEIADDQIMLAPGVGVSLDYPGPRTQHGLLAFFYETSEEVGFLWFVDGDSSTAQLRLYFQDVVWDIMRNPADGSLITTKPNRPDLTQYQSPRPIRYPDLGIDGVLIGRTKMMLLAVQTFQDLVAGVPFSFPKGYDPRVAGSNWTGLSPEWGMFGAGSSSTGKPIRKRPWSKRKK